MFDSIIVVCVGNICRSPTGERLLQQKLPNKKITSAGIGALVGKPMDASAALVASEHGLTCDNHTAQQLSSEHISQNELILVMEHGHVDAICQKHPHARGKVMLFGKWQNDLDIPDPYKQSREAFDHCYKLLTTAADSWAKALG